MIVTSKAIYFDMDGTLANLYGVQDWLPKLRASDPSPFVEAEVMLNMQALAHRLNNLQKKGWTIGIISWLSMDSDEAYNEAVTDAKMEWLEQHLNSVYWNEIHIVPYGEKKHLLADVDGGILFDDNKAVRKDWMTSKEGGVAFPETQIMEILELLAEAVD